MRKFLSTFLMIIATFIIVLVLISIGSLMGVMQQQVMPRIAKPSILVLDLDGVILDGKDLLEDLRKYRKEEKIKGVLLRVNSPGGVVGTSQEIYAELKRVREELQKPVVVSCSDIAASGAYYAAVAADQIFVNPGTLMGSIGVIMQFANLERLYDWAKISPFVIKTGQYKDAGSSIRAMREDEKLLFQELANNVHSQFKSAVQLGRKLTPAVVDKYADGRVFTGAMAVELGFADKVGTYHSALQTIGELSGLGQDPEVFMPPGRRAPFYELLNEAKAALSFKQAADELLNLKLIGRPLFLLPAAIGR